MLFCSVQLLSRVQLFVTPWTAVPQASLSITNSQSLLKLKSTGLVMPSNHLILCHPLLLLPSIFPSIRVFSNESVLPNTHQYMCREKMISNQYSREKTFLMHFFSFFQAKEIVDFILPGMFTYMPGSCLFFFFPSTTAIGTVWRLAIII